MGQHFAIGFGLKVIEHGYGVLFTTAAALTPPSPALGEGHRDDNLEGRLVPILYVTSSIGRAGMLCRVALALRAI